MKKTYTINISGSVFHIEDDAYEKLSQYLAGLKKHFGEDEEGQEIYADIEARVAEIFNLKKTHDNEVITIGWVNEAINTMGVTEDFGDDGNTSSTASNKKRLYRDPDEKIIGGVCGGAGSLL